MGCSVGDNCYWCVRLGLSLAFVCRVIVIGVFVWVSLWPSSAALSETNQLQPLKQIIDTNEERMKEVVGTLYTMAPEVLNGGISYDMSCDMWSIGVMAFVLLSGDMPFDHSTKQRLVKAVEDGRYEFSGRRWDGVSVDAR